MTRNILIEVSHEVRCRSQKWQLFPGLSVQSLGQITAQHLSIGAEVTLKSEERCKTTQLFCNLFDGWKMRLQIHRTIAVHIVKIRLFFRSWQLATMQLVVHGYKPFGGSATEVVPVKQLYFVVQLRQDADQILAKVSKILNQILHYDSCIYQSRE